MASVMENMTNWMNEHLAPLAGRMGQSKVLQAISQGMVMTMPLTIGMAVVAIVINLPIPGLSDWMVASGVTATANEMINSTMSLLAIYVSFLIAYVYAKNDGMNGVTAGVLSMASFLMLVPSTIQIDEETTLNAYQQNYLGSDGLFVAIILAILVAAAFGWLTRKDIKLKLPDSVPPMVADSLSPAFTAMIIFAVVFFVKWGLTMTSFGNIFELIKQVISAPLMNFGATPTAMIAIMTIANIVWCFGVHPSSVTSVYVPVFITVTMANIAAYQAGDPLPDAKYLMLYNCLYFGGTGNTICLCLDMLFAKSEKFKAMRKLMLLPNLFNITEPVIFGVPVMLNPLFFVPMLLSCIVPGVVGMLLLNILPIAYNPTVQLPWVMPTFITAFMQGGPLYMLIILACIAVTCVVWYPFFKIADNQALEEERALAAEKAAAEA